MYSVIHQIPACQYPVCHAEPEQLQYGLYSSGNRCSVVGKKNHEGQDLSNPLAILKCQALLFCTFAEPDQQQTVLPQVGNFVQYNDRLQ